ncbi:MAG: hypothetical protein IMY67_08255 [Bacteroidetes bacterium]|nr:hypothetical protein [Bacteroidota bacterium]
MDENQIALEAAKLSLDLKHSQFLSDLVKIGIPSLVAIISGVITYKVSLNTTSINFRISELAKSHEEKLTKLNIEHEKIKIIDERRHKLVLEMANDLAEICNSNIEYLRNLATLKHGIQEGKEIPKVTSDKVLSQYLISTKITDELLSKVISFSLLTGNKVLVSELNVLGLLLVKIYADCVSDSDITFEEVVSFRGKLQDTRSKIFEVMSDEFNRI